MDTLDVTHDEEDLELLQDNPQHLSDILVTQVILCMAVVTGVFIVNIFKPDVSKYFIDAFKLHTQVEFSESVKYILGWLYDRV